MNIAESGTPVEYDGVEIAVELPDGRVFDYCRRCGGCGRYSFNLVDGTVCYGCNGTGLGRPTTMADAVRRANKRRAAQRKRQREVEAAEARRVTVTAQWRAQHAQFLAELERVAESSGDAFLRELAGKAEWNPLTDAQMGAARTAVIREAAKLAEREARDERARRAGHVGRVGEKLTIEVEIVGTKIIETAYNGRPVSKVLVTMRDDAGHTLKTFSSGDFGWSAEKGQRLTISGTVKEHSTYRELPETTLTRVKAA